MGAWTLLWVALCGAATGADGSWPDLATPPAAAAGDGSKDAALVVAVEDYVYAQDLPGAVANGRAWYAWLKDARKVPTVKVLENGYATRESILDAARETAARVKPGGRLWVVYIGHGAPSRAGNDGVLVGADAMQTASSLEARSVPQGELLAAVAGAQADTVVVLDACFSGKTAGGDLAPGLAPLKAVQALTTANTTVLTAARGDQYAGPLSDGRRPAFSYLVLGGLRGWADADGDRLVTAREAVDYADQVLFETASDRKQNPSLSGPDVPLGRSAGERAPTLSALRTTTRAAGVPATTTTPATRTSGGGFGDLAIDVDVDAKLKEQACEDDARKKGAAARAARLDAAAKGAQAEASAAWGKLSPQAEACAKLTDTAARKECAATVDAFVARAAALEVSVEAGLETAETACGSRSAAFPAETRRVAVAESGKALSVSSRLKGDTPQPAATELSHVVIDTMIRSNKAVKTCFITEKGESGELPRGVKVRLVVRPSGKVDSAAIAGGAWSGTPFDTCLSSAMAAIEFPPWEGEAMSFVYPFQI